MPLSHDQSRRLVPRQIAVHLFGVTFSARIFPLRQLRDCLRGRSISRVGEGRGRGGGGGGSWGGKGGDFFPGVVFGQVEDREY